MSHGVRSFLKYVTKSNNHEIPISQDQDKSRSPTPTPSVRRRTENITFPRTPYVVGNANISF